MAGVAKCNGDGSAPLKCNIKNCGMAFTAATHKRAFRIKTNHEQEHIFYPERFKNPKKYFENYKQELANYNKFDCNAEIFMSD